METMIEFFISHLNSTGLIIDIIGVTILFFVVISPSEQIIRIDENIELERKKKLYRKELVLKSGYVFIILGFIFQLLSNETKTTSKNTEIEQTEIEQTEK